MPFFGPYIALFEGKKSIFHRTMAKRIPYKSPFGVEEDDIGPGNTYFWNVNIEESIR